MMYKKHHGISSVEKTETQVTTFGEPQLIKKKVYGDDNPIIYKFGELGFTLTRRISFILYIMCL